MLTHTYLVAASLPLPWGLVCRPHSWWYAGLTSWAIRLLPSTSSSMVRIRSCMLKWLSGLSDIRMQAALSEQPLRLYCVLPLCLHATNRGCHTGDFVDRGAWGLEVLIMLAAMKLAAPQHITLLRGNHESSTCTQLYGFRTELFRKYGAEVRAALPPPVPGLILSRGFSSVMTC